MASMGAAVGAMVLLLIVGEAKTSETESADKSQYTLFNPTPKHLMRPLTTDRPHFTENPFTVDAGHLQIETGLFGYALSRPDLEGTTTEDFAIAAANFRIGVTNSAALWHRQYAVIRSIGSVSQLRYRWCAPPRKDQSLGQ